MPRLTLVATGASSGLGFEAVRQVLEAAPSDTSYNIILGCRDVTATRSAYAAAAIADRHKISCHTLDLCDLVNVKSFALQVLEDLGGQRLNTLLLCAGISKAAGKSEQRIGHSEYCEAFIVNYSAQQYVMLLLEDKLKESHARIVVVTSMLYKKVTETTSLKQVVSAGSQASAIEIYRTTKFIQLASLQNWRTRLGDHVKVIAVSPGFVPETNLSRETSWIGRLFMYYILPYAPFATSLKAGGAAIALAITLSPSEDQRRGSQQAVLSKTGHLEPLTDIVLQKHVAEDWFLSIQDIEQM